MAHRFLEIAGDLAIAVALVWALPLAVGIAAALVKLAFSVMN